MNKKLITLNKRLALYKKALSDYKRANKCKTNEAFRKLNISLCCGFCLYFLEEHSLDVYDNKYKRELPELWKQRPKGTTKNSSWFPEGFNGVKDRIVCLNDAIKLTKQKINLHKSI